MHGGGFSLGTAGPACERCGSLTYCTKWEQAFAVKLCASCKKDEKLLSKVGQRVLCMVAIQRSRLPTSTAEYCQSHVPPVGR